MGKPSKALAWEGHPGNRAHIPAGCVRHTRIRRNMPFEGRPLRELTAQDIRGLIASGLQEHAFLEYKSELYEDNDRGRREFLLDICMFANAQGGLLLIGVPEQRDPQGQPTGVPNNVAELGIPVENAEAVLLAYDARATATIEERLPLEAAAIRIGGRFVLAFRVMNSTNKPHCVRYKGHVYFPSRRERQRYELSVREIKQLVMETTTQIERAERLLSESLIWKDSGYGPGVRLYIGLVPVFFRDFLIDLGRPEITDAVGRLDLHALDGPRYMAPTYNFEGLQRSWAARLEDVVRFSRNGLLRARIDVIREYRGGDNIEFLPSAVDVLVRQFILRSQPLYLAAGLSSPSLLQIEFVSNYRIRGMYTDGVAIEMLDKGESKYPALVIEDIHRPVDQIIRPLCDHVHQSFGHDRSPCFDAEGRWVNPRR